MDSPGGTAIGADSTTALRRWHVLVVCLVVVPLAIGAFAPISFERLLAGDRSQWVVFMGWIAVWEWSAFGLIVYWLRRNNQSLASIGWPRVTLADGVVLGTILLVLGALAVLKPVDPDVPIDATTFLLPRAPAEKLFFLFMALTAGICEETIFRGYGITQLRASRLSAWTAVAISTLSFVAMHGLYAQSAVAAIARGAVGLAFAGLFLWRRSLRGPIYIHFLIDAPLVLIV